MADLGVGAVHRVEVGAAINEAFELCFQPREFVLSRPNGVQLGIQQGANVGARGGAVTTQVEDAGDFDKRQSRCLGAANEPELGKA